MNKLTQNLAKLGHSAADNVGFLVAAVLVVAVILLVAYAAEALIHKAHGEEPKKAMRVHRITLIAMLTAIAEILMLFDFPLWFAPSVYKMDFSEIPVLIGAFTMGPVAGVIIEFLKVFLNLFINGTNTAFVGEFANFCMGCSFVIPAAIFYYAKKTKVQAIIGMAVGTIVGTFAGCFLNAYLLLPTYAKAFHMSTEAIVSLGTKVNSSIQDIFTFVVLAVAPFNLVKYTLVSIITMCIYKKISMLLKKKI